jgi:hypothetical protein
MPIFIVISGHTTEYCPIHNEQAKKMFLESFSKFGELTTKHGLKVLGNYAVMPEHKNYMIVDAPSADAFQKAMMEPAMMQFIGHNMTEIKLAMPIEDAMKMLR